MVKKFLRWPFILSLVIVLALVGVWCYSYYLREIKVEPMELIVKALDTTNRATSYRFHVEASLITGGNKIDLSSLDGERGYDGSLYLKGQMTGQPVEIYQVEDTTYFRDPTSKRWMVTPGNNPLEQEKYMAEINPLSILKITRVDDLKFLGRQKKVPGRPYLLTCRPQVNNQFFNSYWQDPYYQLWVERGSNYIRKVSLEAAHRQHPQDKLTMTVDFYDFNKRINIKTPQ
ncbi:hypothetical protein [Moorella sulfitireducens (nom. illeg.)]|uniref:hypothetical protein n=1 Tax=Neomoorella sulfitireducens TaxID=2972948 RepID=UPI0021AD0792|nr:hypothetical protein [Moorella sulfitireducens]